MAVALAAASIFPAAAGEADIRDVAVTPDDEGTYRFDVTVAHADEGWDHYANAFVVLAPDGETILGTRELLHPHTDEQPFTRSLGGVAIPDDIESVIVRARDSVHGFGGEEIAVQLPRR